MNKKKDTETKKPLIFAIAQYAGFHAKKEIMLNVHELLNWRVWKKGAKFSMKEKNFDLELRIESLEEKLEEKLEDMEERMNKKLERMEKKMKKKINEVEVWFNW